MTGKLWRYLNVPSALNMSVAPVAGAPMYAAYVGGASEDIAVDAAGLGGVHVAAGVRVRTGLATGGSAVGAGRAEVVGCCMRSSGTGCVGNLATWFPLRLYATTQRRQTTNMSGMIVATMTMVSMLS